MSTLEARREARRRKILENSASRLQKITKIDETYRHTEDTLPPTEQESVASSFNHENITSTSTTNPDKTEYNIESPLKISFFIPRRIPVIPTPVEQSMVPPPAIPDALDIAYATPNVEDTYDDDDEDDDYEDYEESDYTVDGTESESDVEPPQPSLYDKPQVRAWMIMLTAITTRFLIISSDLVSTEFILQYHLNQIFVPLLVYEIYHPPKTQSGIFNILLMLNTRFQPNQIRRFITFCKIAAKILQDIAVYCFGFIFFDRLNALSDGRKALIL